MGHEEKLKEKISRLPDLPGVYLFQDAAGGVLYVGKAKSLKKRVTSYVRSGGTAKTMALMERVADVEYRVCQTESMALLLEASLIRQHKPRYNVSLRDDKTYPWVKITDEEFPAVCITRKKEPDGASYFGPYTSVKLLRSALKIIRKSFPYRSCATLPSEACIYYRLGLSPAPCAGKIDRRQYRRTIEQISLILEGKTGTLLTELNRAMEDKSRTLQFEEAAKIRDQITSLGALNQGQASSRDQLDDLKRMLNLARLPERIEAFDISDISGQEACGSMVSFFQGLPDKNNYRRFRIKTVGRIDDYAMLKEVVMRRYRRLVEERLPFPDLILIDGGKGHLRVAGRVLAELGLALPLASIAKDRENVYTREKLRPIRLRTDTPGLNLIRRVRDEAHRFALAYHRVLRRKKALGR